MDICIIGGCVSRDLLSHDRAGYFSLSRYIARSSFASIFAQPPFDDVYSCQIKSSFQAKMVARDIQKTSRELIAQSRADVVLIDFMVERLNLLRSPTGGLCTISDEVSPLLKSKLRNLDEGWAIVRSGSDAFLEAWRSGWNQFMDLMEKNGMADRVLVQRVHWQPLTASGNRFPQSSDARINEVNAVLDILYGIAGERLLDSQFLQYEPGTLECPDHHQWGPAPFHFSASAQQYGLQKVREFCAHRHDAPGCSDKLRI